MGVGTTFVGPLELQADNVARSRTIDSNVTMTRFEGWYMLAAPLPGHMEYTGNMNSFYLTDYPTRTTKAPLDVLMMRKIQVLCLITEAEIAFSQSARYLHYIHPLTNPK